MLLLKLLLKCCGLLFKLADVIMKHWYNLFPIYVVPYLF